MVTLLLVRNTLDGCQATNTIMWERRPYLFILIVTICLVVCLFFIIVCSVAFVTFFITFMPFAFSYPIIFCAYRLSTSMPRDNRCSRPGIKFRKTYARTCFELTLKALANEDALFRTHCFRHKCFPVCPWAQHLLRTQILCPGHKKCFWFCSEIFCVRNKCFPVCAAQETSWATMCQQQCVLVYQGLNLSCFSAIIISRKKRCIVWPFKLTSDLFLLVNNIRNWRILRLH